MLTLNKFDLFSFDFKFAFQQKPSLLMNAMATAGCISSYNLSLNLRRRVLSALSDGVKMLQLSFPFQTNAVCIVIVQAVTCTLAGSFI